MTRKPTCDITAPTGKKGFVWGISGVPTFTVKFKPGTQISSTCIKEGEIVYIITKQKGGK